MMTRGQDRVEAEAGARHLGRSGAHRLQDQARGGGGRGGQVGDGGDGGDEGGGGDGGGGGRQ